MGMPMFKSAKNAHSGCYGIWRYLTQKNRAQGLEVFNINTQKERWYADMDGTRKAFGNDKPYNGRKAITYRHYIISPDPKDNVSVEQVLELGCRWVKDNYSDYQAAVVVHTDTGIPHVHVVINNTNLKTGKRLNVTGKENEELLPNSVQRIAAEMGLSPLPKLTYQEPRSTTQPNKRKQSEKKICTKGRFSWKEDIRLAVIDIARETEGPVTFKWFQNEMQKRGFDVWKTKRGGYTFQHYAEIPGSETHERWKCKDIKLGFAYTPAGMARYYHIGAEQPEVDAFFKAAEQRHIRSYGVYLQKRTELLSDLTLQDRIDTINL